MGGITISKRRKHFKWPRAERSSKTRTENELLIQGSGGHWVCDKHSLHGVMGEKLNWNGLRENMK